MNTPKPASVEMMKTITIALFATVVFFINGFAWAITGDVNSDGVVNDIDVTLVEKHVTGEALLSPDAQLIADLNLNGQVDVGDLIGLAKLKTDSIRIVPNVLHEGWQRAEYLLTQAGLTMGQRIEVKSDSYTGTVVGQIPGVGVGVPQGTAVDLYVSAGQNSGSYLEIIPDSVDLGESNTQATFEVRCIGGDIPWTTGMWADYTASPPSGIGSGHVTLTLDRTRLPFGKGALTFAVIPDNSGSSSGAYATVHFNQTVYPPPVVDLIRGHVPVSPGDTIRLGGDYFAQNASDNIIEVNGVQVAGSSVHFSPPTLTFQLPAGVSSGMASIRVRRHADATLGSSPWGRALVTRLVDPTEIELTAGPDGGNLWVEPAWFSLMLNWDEYNLVDRSVGPADWVLGGRNFSLVSGANVNEVEDPPNIWGTSDPTFYLETIIASQRFFLPARALNDTQVIVTPQIMNPNRKAAFFALLTPGRFFSARLLGSEKNTFYPRASNWVQLRVAPQTPPIGSVVKMNAHGLTLSNVYHDDWTNDTVLQVAQGTTLSITRDTYETMVLRAPGLWAGDFSFFGQSDYTSAGNVAKCVTLNSPGLYTITNLTNGTIRKIEVLEGGAPYEWYSTAEYARLPSTASNIVVPPDQDVTIMVNGASVHIPAGALPTDEGQMNLVSFSYQILYSESYQLSDPEADDGKERFDLFFRRAHVSGTEAPVEWEPAELLEPITIEAYYSEAAAQNGPPTLAVLDEAAGLYWDLPCTVDAAKRKLTLVLPAATYGSQTAIKPAKGGLDSQPELNAAPANLPPVSLHQITRHMGIPYLKSARSVMRDDNNWFAVDYISDSSSSSYVTDAYAEGILDILVDTYENLKGRQWKEPDGTTFIYLRKTLLGGYGSSTKGVFGRPTITINIAECTAGSAAYFTTPAHEVGHIFQRNYTTNIIAKWFDEATAEWIALDTVGGGSFLTDNLNDAMPFVSSLPSGFTFGFSTAEGYAASPWPVWLNAHYSSSIRKIYEALDGNPLNWERHHSVVASATGKTIESLYRDFAKEYWLQSFDPMTSVDLHGQANALGLPVGVTMTESGDVTFGNSRPALSSLRISVQPNQACLDKFANRSAVIRFTPGADAMFYEASVYGDRAGVANIPNEPQAVTSFYPSGPDSFVLNNLGQHRTYRFILANGSTSKTFNPSFRIVFPTINSLSPSSGRKTGGYIVSVNGFGFGPTQGSISMGGSSVAITSWNDTQIRFTMPDVGDNTGEWSLTVRTAEDVATNTRTFTFTN